jgi:hypothetical protein
LYESAVDLDKSVSVIRTDFFDHALSFALAKQLDIWAPTVELEEAIKTHTSQQIKVNENEFTSVYKWIKGYSKVKWVDNIQVVNFYDMVKLKNSKEFCEFFQLPFVEFDYHQFVVEYGDNKRKMVSNIKQLRLLASKIDDMFNSKD